MKRSNANLKAFQTRPQRPAAVVNLRLIVFSLLTLCSQLCVAAEDNQEPVPSGAPPKLASISIVADKTASSTIRQAAAYSLVRLSDSRAELVSTLCHIANEEPTERRWALKALSVLKEESASCVADLKRLASDKSLSLDERLLAAESLAYAAIRQPAVVGWFYEILRDPKLSTEELRGFVSVARVLGPNGGPLTPTLLKLLESDDFQTQFAAVETIGIIGSPLALESLMFAALDNDQPIIADAAATSIDLLAAPIANAFETLIKEGDATVRHRVAMTWKRKSAARLAAFHSLLTDDAEAVQVQAAFALLEDDRAAAMATLQQLAASTTRPGREARKILRGIEIGRIEPPACRPE